jgi:hypothetical protein
LWEDRSAEAWAQDFKSESEYGSESSSKSDSSSGSNSAPAPESASESASESAPAPAPDSSSGSKSKSNSDSGSDSDSGSFTGSLSELDKDIKDMEDMLQKFNAFVSNFLGQNFLMIEEPQERIRQQLAFVKSHIPSDVLPLNEEEFTDPAGKYLFCLLTLDTTLQPGNKDQEDLIILVKSSISGVAMAHSVDLDENMDILENCYKVSENIYQNDRIFKS